MVEYWRKVFTEQHLTPWKKMGCSKACWNAKNARCKCKCKGQFHGMGRIMKPQTEEEFKAMINVKTLSEETSEKLYETLEEALAEHPEWEKYFERINL